MHLGYHHNVPLHSGPAAALHGLPDPPGAHVEEASVWTLAAYPKWWRCWGMCCLSATALQLKIRKCSNVSYYGNYLNYPSTQTTRYENFMYKSIAPLCPKCHMGFILQEVNLECASNASDHQVAHKIQQITSESAAISQNQHVNVKFDSSSFGQSVTAAGLIWPDPASCTVWIKYTPNTGSGV